MTQSPVYKKTIRQYNSPPPPNTSSQDFITKSGVRTSAPLYVNISQETRKEWLNELRRLASATTVREVTSSSGISTETSINADAGIESYLGLTLDTLRSAVLFQRGGIPLDMVIKLQSVTGIEAVSEKDIASALKARVEDVNSFIADRAFETK
ncbi:hypothetical protein [Synechococcus sp. CC9605]|uniref:hypothetical protein n=1 Tax=Synechococcus sp. (strain CC9605) TaxID=110662 RepID=UPI00005D58A4|nr:hypothetical protein [Synechococcus sp. CC9605]ABB34628.1 hypothetical protein Syncc9605_0860 [Synechococcus sp. CC9605]